MSLDERIKSALHKCPLDSYELARIVWPIKTCGKAWRHSANGVPPGWVLPLGKAIVRMGLRTWHEKHRKMIALSVTRAELKSIANRPGCNARTRREIQSVLESPPSIPRMKPSRVRGSVSGRDPIEVTLPLRTRTECNTNEMHWAKSRREREQRAMVVLMIGRVVLPELPIRVTLTRLGPAIHGRPRQPAIRRKAHLRPDRGPVRVARQRSADKMGVLPGETKRVRRDRANRANAMISCRSNYCETVIVVGAVASNATAYCPEAWTEPAYEIVVAYCPPDPPVEPEDETVEVPCRPEDDQCPEVEDVCERREKPRAVD